MNSSTIPSGSVITQVVVYSTGSDVRMCHQFQLHPRSYISHPANLLYILYVRVVIVIIISSSPAAAAAAA